MGVVEIFWSNDKGGTGVAIGTTDWTVDDILLQPGANVITVTAIDTDGNADTDEILVIYDDNPLFQQVEELHAADGEQGDEFGEALAVNGGKLIVTAHARGDDGAAYMFVRGSDNWVQLQEVVPPSGQSISHFGVAADYDGSTAVLEHGADALSCTARPMVC